MDPIPFWVQYSLTMEHEGLPPIFPPRADLSAALLSLQEPEDEEPPLPPEELPLPPEEPPQWPQLRLHAFPILE